MAARGLSAALLAAACSSAGEPTYNADEGSGDSVPGGEVEVGGGDAFGDGEGDATESTTSVSTTGDDDDDDDGTTDTGEESGDDTTTGEPPVPIPSPACGGNALSPGEYNNVDLDVGDAERRYDLHVPALHDGITPLPLILNLHEAGFGEDDQRTISGMTDAAEQEGFVAVHPRGAFDSWNAGDCCGGAEDNDIDDVGFIRSLIEELGQEVCIDERLVYVTGFGNGGSMAYRLACEASDVIAAAASVAGVMAVETPSCTPLREVPVMHFHGTNDFVAPYDGGGPFGGASVLDNAQNWQTINGCMGMSVVTFDLQDTLCERWSDCAGGSEVALCTIEGMGHCWPGHDQCGGPTSKTLSATSAMLEFFATHPLP